MCRRIMTILLAASLYTAGFSLPSGDSTATITMFWNVENYFDPFDDSLKKDDEFTPEGFKHWTWGRFCRKRNAIAKTIIAARDTYGDYPLVVGLAEVENYMVLRQLVNETSLSRLDYGIIHRDGPDSRGIECAMLYRKERFTPTDVRTFEVNTGSGRATRDILYVKGITACDTMEFLIVHMPSKFGGEKASAPLRDAAAQCLLRSIDSTGGPLHLRKIIVMGDFNDSPASSSVRTLTDKGLIYTGEYLMQQEKDIGTIKFNGQWELIDHFLATPPLGHCKMYIYAPEQLLESDTKYLGVKPFRTYYGPTWNGGTSDHLPIVLVIN